MQYSEEIKNSIDNNVISKQDIYEFHESSFADLFANFYLFCRENLDIQAKEEKIAPNIFLYFNSFEVNAGAGLVGNNFVITINLGLFKSCIDNYYTNANLLEYFQKLYPDTIQKFDNPVNILAFQICTQYSYYHELAHLFQLSNKKTEVNLQERNDKEPDNTFDRTRHILEINADTYASIAVTTHIEQYIGGIFGEEVTQKNTIETFVFFCCCLLNYTLNFSVKPEEIYFEKHTHPHSFIRQLNTVLNIVNHVQQSPYFNKSAITIDSNELFLTVIDIYKDLEKNGVFKTNVSEIILKNKELSRPLANYLYSLIQFETTEYINAMDVWNKQVK